MRMTDTSAIQARPYIDKSDNFLRLKDYRSALDAAVRAAAIDPNNGDAYMHQAISLAALKELGEALKILDKAIETFAANGPRDALPAAHNLRASYKNEAGDYRGAKEDATAAVGINPKFADGYYQRSVAEKNLGQKAEATADLKEAATYDPERYQDLYAAAAREAEGRADAATRPVPTFASRLTDKAGGAVPLAAAGALFVLFAAYVMFFAKDRSRRFSTWSTPDAQPAANDGPMAINSKYARGRKVGSGGMGDVYEGKDNELRRRVAIKSLRAELQVRPRERERFVEEARKVAALHHPHIIEIYDIVQAEAGTFIVFEYVEGQTLHEKRSDGPAGRMPAKTALRYLRQAAEAVDHAHKRGVVHRDLKPSNIMIDEHDRVKVMDFGIARFVQDTLRDIQTNTIVGTPPYMAPEQSAGKVTKSSDVYALAVSFYELLAGQLPFRGDDLSAKIGRIYMPLSQAVPGMPPALDAVIARALDPDPEKRQGTCLQFFEQAAAILDGRTTPA
ncbi:MAG: protein kinase [Elusimicrobia bacterium]|nr:protein kinase [Elusimicrobiota bacterium]